ncbi:MAG: transposase [Xenococcaceae cyanobacterium MO_234.B1]|nr:transposase [Xenococcaceae cyanobacterium MO_234.B1]
MTPACCSYADICFLKKQDCDAVIRLHKSRKQQLKKGKRIGPCDQLVTWQKPKSRPKGLSQEEFDSLPEALMLREVHYYICLPGWRTKEVTLITTLLDAQVYPIKELLKIYELRWDVELDLRNIKTSLGMDILRGKTPEMVRKEIYVHLFNNFVSELKDVSLKKRQKLSQIMLNIIAHKPLKKRGGRFEPRVKKRRPLILSIDARTKVYS